MLGETKFMHQLNRKLLHEATRRAEQVLEAAAIRCAEEGVAFKPLEDVGDPYVRIPEESHRYDLVLLGRVTHFEFGFDKIADDTLTRILRESPRPVVVVPSTLGDGEAVVVAFDGSVQASRALQAFEASGARQGSNGPRGQHRRGTDDSRPARRPGHRFPGLPRDQGRAYSPCLSRRPRRPCS